MAQITVEQFAGELKLPTALLLEQLKSAGVNKSNANDLMSETDKAALLEHLRKEHGTLAPKNKITLTRKSSTEIKKTDNTGKARTIQVEVRKKRVIEQRDELIAPIELTPEVPVSEPVVEEKAVSYTHLDVYKRQVINGVEDGHVIVEFEGVLYKMALSNIDKARLSPVF